MVKTNYPIHQVLKRLDLTGRMVSWSMELYEYNTKYIPRGSIKLQVLAKFLTEFNSPVSEEAPTYRYYL